MFIVCFVNPKKTSLFFIITSLSFFVNTAAADNLPSCSVGAIENSAIIATTSHLTDNFDGTISDPKTGLIWKKCGEDQVWFSSFLAASNVCIDVDLSDPGTYNWSAALQRVQDVNTGTGQNFSQTDWRLPNIKELLSTVELRCADLTINNTVFPNVVTESFWSSSPSASSSFSAWGVNYFTGYGSTMNRGGGNVGVRLVRSGQ
jgi:hypothetical protein